MSSYNLRQADGGVWYIHWTEGRRSRRVSTRTKDLAAAKSFLATWLTLETEGAAAAAVTCAEAWGAYWRGHFSRKKLPESVRAGEFAWKNLEPHFGALPVRSVSQTVVDDYVASRAVGLVGRQAGDATCRRELTLLRASWNWCVKMKFLAADDVPYFVKPAASTPKDRWLTEEQVRAVFAAAEQMRRERPGAASRRLSRVERFLWLAHHTAARKSAILRLTWDRVDFETNVINYAEPGRVETRKRRVAVPIGKTLRPVLLRAYEERQNDLVMTTPSDIIDQLLWLEERAKVGHLHPHLFRHTAATHMARAGVDLWVIAGILGDTIATVTKNYLKHCPEHLRGGVETLSLGAKSGAAPVLGVENGLHRPTMTDNDRLDMPVNQ